MENYTFIEFMVKPSLMRDYIQDKNQLTRRAIFQSYMEHMQSLCTNEKINEQFTKNKKLRRLLKILLIVSQYYTPSYNDFNIENLQYELVDHFINAAIQKLGHDYYLIGSAYTIAYLKEYVMNKELSEEKIAQYLNYENWEREIAQAQNSGLSLLNIQLMIEFKLYQESFKIESLFELHDQIAARNADTPPEYSKEKIEDYRTMIMSLHEELSPVTDIEEMQVESPPIETTHNEPYNSYFHPDMLVTWQSHKTLVVALYNAITMNNKDWLAQIKYINNTNTNDLLIDHLISLHTANPNTLQISQVEFIIKQLDFTSMNEVYIIGLYLQVIIQKCDQIRHLRKDPGNSWQDIGRCLAILASKFNKPVTFTLAGLQEFLNHLLGSDTSMPVKIDLYVMNMQIAIAMLLCFFIIVVHSNEIQDLKALIIMLDQIVHRFNTQLQWDTLTTFIQNSLSKSIVDTLQCLLLKTSDSKEHIPYYSLMPKLFEFNAVYEMKINIELRNQLVRQCFKREKFSMKQQFEQLKLEEQIEFRYAKLYKKQYSFYYKNKQYAKSLRQILKFFEAYLTPASLSEFPYMHEPQAIEYMFANLKVLQLPALALLASQFTKAEIPLDFFHNLELNQEQSELFFDARIIEKICNHNAGNFGLVKLMLERMRHPDSYQFKSPYLAMTTQERYLHLYLSYLSQQVLINQI